MSRTAATVTAALAALALACPGKSQPPGDSPPEGSGPTGSSQTMSPGFARAYSSFRDHAARQLAVAPDQVRVGPSYERAAVEHERTVGRAWAFQGATQATEVQVRGWATADGTVVTRDANLGVLFAEAGVWSGAPTLDARQLAERLVWSMGMNHRVFIDLDLGAAVPVLAVDPDGSGKLDFHVAYRQPGPGGAGGGPEDHFHVVVVLGPDRSARLQSTRVEPAR